MYCQLFFFFKQKTAYELRISDWSSDVCSSDLPVLLGQLGICLKEGTNSDQRRLTVQTTLLLVEICRQHTGRATHFAFLGAIENMRGPFKHMIDVRSEEHTSELQSLMRISYAVFCLKKKKKHRLKTITQKQ